MATLHTPPRIYLDSGTLARIADGDVPVAQVQRFHGAVRALDAVGGSDPASSAPSSRG